MTKGSVKQRIINEAINEFAENYFDNASINSIIKRSNTSKGTFYHYFKNKEDLYFQLIDMVVKEKIAYIDNRVNEELITMANISLFSENFRTLTRIGMEFATKNPQYYQIGIKMLEEPNIDILNIIIGKYGNQSKHFIAQLVDKAMDLDLIDKVYSRDFINLVSYILNNYIKIVPEKDRMDFGKLMDYLDQIYIILENGLKPVK